MSKRLPRACALFASGLVHHCILPSAVAAAACWLTDPVIGLAIYVAVAGSKLVAAAVGRPYV